MATQCTQTVVCHPDSARLTRLQSAISCSSFLSSRINVAIMYACVLVPTIPIALTVFLAAAFFATSDISHSADTSSTIFFGRRTQPPSCLHHPLRTCSSSQLHQLSQTLLVAELRRLDGAGRRCVRSVLIVGRLRVSVHTRPRLRGHTYVLQIANTDGAYECTCTYIHTPKDAWTAASAAACNY
jgi:hypothetical protein